MNLDWQRMLFRTLLSINGILLLFLLSQDLFAHTLSNFISNTATAALLVPILAVVCKGMGNSLNAIGGGATILIGVAIAASAAMCLPISTPPNAICTLYWLGRSKANVKIGGAMGALTMIIGYVVLYLVAKMHII